MMVPAWTETCRNKYYNFKLFQHFYDFIIVYNSWNNNKCFLPDTFATLYQTTRRYVREESRFDVDWELSKDYDSPVDDTFALQVVQCEGQFTDVKHDAVLTESHFLLHVVSQVTSQQKVRHQEQVLFVCKDMQHTDRLTPWSRDLLEKLSLPQPVKKLPKLCRTFITVFKSSGVGKSLGTRDQ